MKKYFFILSSILFYNICIAQERKLVYDVVRSGKVIGEIHFVELVKGQKKFLSLTSDVETTLLFPVTDHTSETAAYDKGIMVYSSFYQKQTGSDVINRTAKVSGKSYKVTGNGDLKSINPGVVRYSTLLLYTTEPKNITKVFSGNLQQMVDLEKIAENKYSLILPGGKVNDYTYKNGVCTKVEIVRSIMSVEFVLREK